jgi:hypothetical protein
MWFSFGSMTKIVLEHTPSCLPVPQAGGHPSQEGNYVFDKLPYKPYKLY